MCGLLSAIIFVYINVIKHKYIPALVILTFLLIAITGLLCSMLYKPLIDCYRNMETQERNVNERFINREVNPIIQKRNLPNGHLEYAIEMIDESDDESHNEINQIMQITTLTQL